MEVILFGAVSGFGNPSVTSTSISKYNLVCPNDISSES